MVNQNEPLVFKAQWTDEQKQSLTRRQRNDLLMIAGGIRHDETDQVLFLINPADLRQ